MSRNVVADAALATYADTTAIKALTGFEPNTPLEVGLGHFVRWYRDYYKV